MPKLILSRSEIKTMQTLCSGKLYKEIADDHKVSINTVKKHLKNAYRKLEVRNRKCACNKFIENFPENNMATF